MLNVNLKLEALCHRYDAEQQIGRCQWLIQARVGELNFPAMKPDLALNLGLDTCNGANTVHRMRLHKGMCTNAQGDSTNAQGDNYALTWMSAYLPSLHGSVNAADAQLAILDLYSLAHVRVQDCRTAMELQSELALGCELLDDSGIERA